MNTNNKINFKKNFSQNKIKIKHRYLDSIENDEYYTKVFNQLKWFYTLINAN